MGLEDFDYIGSLNPDWPQGSESLSESDDHHRGTKKATQASFPNVTGEVYRTHHELNALVTLDDIPDPDFPAGTWAEDDGAGTEVPANKGPWGTSKVMAVAYQPNMVAWLGGMDNPRIPDHDTHDWRISLEFVINGVSGGNVKFRADVYLYPNGDERTKDTPDQVLTGADFAVSVVEGVQQAYPNFTIVKSGAVPLNYVAISISRIAADASECVDDVCILRGTLIQVPNP